MSHYQQCLVIEANPDAVYAAVTTQEGLRGWWSQDCDISSSVGDTIHFRFGRNHKDLRIERLDRNREVRWLCTGAYMEKFPGGKEWLGTQIVFRLTAEGDRRTRLDFEHLGLEPTLECYGLCSDGWRYFMDSLQQFVETGRGTPFELAAHATA